MVKNGNNMDYSGDIAVIGISCRFPGGLDSPDKFFDSLMNKKCMIAPPPEKRMPYFDGNSSVYCEKAGFLKEDISLFDNKAFKISDLEAERMDPCQKLMLTVCREAIEDSGYSTDELAESDTGVYVGSSTEEYVPILFDLKRRGLTRSSEDVTGMLHGFLSGKISYAFGLHGPAISVNTACSTSVSALHQAVLGLKAQDCDIAVTGAVNILFLSDITDELAALNILSDTCTVRTFDKDANGTVRGEGAAALVLKRLEDAERDNDDIYCVISGSGLDQDGRSAGITAPYGPAQVKLIKKVWSKAEVSADDVDYIETHGTGTKLGDAIELEALTEATEGRKTSEALYIGSVKPNIGHLEGTSGFAGIIKGIMIIKHKCIPPEINFEHPSDQINWSDVPMKVNTEPVPLNKENGNPVTVCVSSFGLSGTNGHVVLREYIGSSPDTEQSNGDMFIKVSGTSERGLKNQLSQLSGFGNIFSEDQFADMAYSHNTIRSDYKYRTFLKADGFGSLSEAVDSAILKKYSPCKEKRRIIAMFTGQGSQFAGMFREIYDSEPVFREYFDRCSSVYSEVKGGDLCSICFSGDEIINETEFSQPVIFAVEISLYEYFRSLGIEFSAAVGHSIGEYAAAYAAGIFTLEDGMRIVIRRGELMGRTLRQGSMLAVRASADEVRPYAEEAGVYIAASNSPVQTVLSGEISRIDALADKLTAARIKCTKLNVSNGFHSALMDEILEPFRNDFDGVSFGRPKMRVISNVSGKSSVREMMNVDYWVRHIRSEVKFCDGIRSISSPEDNIFLEIGAKPVLASLAQKCIEVPIDTVFMRFGSGNDCDELREAVFRLYSLGVDIKWKELYKNSRHRKLRLPAAVGDLRSLSVIYDCIEDHSDKLCGKDVFDSETVRIKVKDIIKEKLDIDISDTNDEDNLLAYGMSSVLILQASVYIRDIFGVRLGLDELLGSCSLNGWTELILNGLGEETDVEEKNIVSEEHIGVRFPLNKIQEAYFVGRRSEMQWGGTGCSAGFEFDMDELDTERFRSALEKTVQRHEMLRCIITDEGDQYIAGDIELPYSVYRIADINDLSEHLEKIHNEIMYRVFPLEYPLWEIRLTELENGRWRIHFGIDFMIADALSLNIFWRDLESFYKGEELIPLDITYYDYWKYTSVHTDDQQLKEDKEYWYSKAENIPAPPQLPYSDTDEKSLCGRFVRRSAVLTENEYKKLVSESGKHGLTAASVLLELFSEVLASRSSDNSFAVMLTTFRREPVHKDVNNLIGDFTNLMLTEITIDNSGTVENARRIQSTIQSNYSHSTYSAIDLVKYINSLHGTKTFYPVVFTSAIGVGSSYSGNIFTENLSSAASSTPQVFIDHQIYENPDGGITLSWDTADHVFMPDVINDMFEVYIALVKQLCANGINFLDLSDMRSRKDKELQIKANSTYKEIPEADILCRFDEVCAKYGDKAAVVCGDETVTYSELLKMVRKTADKLRTAGIGKGSLVAVDMAKSCRQIAVIAGIVYAGAAYIPMSYGQPDQRTDSIMKRSECRVIVRDSISTELKDQVQLTFDDISVHTGLAERTAVSSEDTAYIIYTSGSTGEPKGVKISHGAAMNTIADVIGRYGINSKDVIFGVSSVSFDLSVFDIFGALNTGATLVLPQEEKRVDPVFWHEYTVKYGVTFWNSVPSIMSLYCDYMQQKGITDNCIRQIILSGDWIPVQLTERIADIFVNAHLTSMGGATEASIWSNYYECSGKEAELRSVPYGYPLSNQRFYILDSYGRPCPRWTEGKLYIGGKGIADGYHNAPELTDKAFFYSEFAGERIYDTGDHGRYISDGMIEFLGRKDQQVKINGYRIELGEITTALRNIGIAGESLVMPVDEKDGGRYLAAFIRKDNHNQLADAAGVKNKLGNILPRYLIPETVIFVDSFPLTVNGKKDRKKLASMAVKNDDNCVDTFTGNENGNLVGTICAALGRHDICAADRFDSIGVSSMDIIKLGNTLERSFGVRPPIYDMMNGFTIGQLAEYYDNHSAVGEKIIGKSSNYVQRSGSFAEDLIIRYYAKGIELYTDDGKLRFRSRKTLSDEDKKLLKENKADIMLCLENGFSAASESFPLADVQKAYLSGRDAETELGGVSAHYYTELEYEGDLDAERFINALNEVVEKQDMLRTVILPAGKQIVLGKSERVGVTVNDPASAEQMQVIRDKWATHTFDTGSFPMFHIELSRFGAKKTVIHFSFDCMIFDGWSTDLMFRQIFDIYNGKEMPPLEYSFRQYVESVEKADDDQYIEEMIANIYTAPELPYSCSLSDIKTPTFSRLSRTFDHEQSESIRKSAEKYGVTLTVYMCTKYMERLSEWSGQKCFTLNLTMYDRPSAHKDAVRLIGDFTNITFISYHGDRYNSFADTVKDIQKQMWCAVEHRSVSGVKIISRLSGQNRGKSAFPVVFTSLAGDNSRSDDSPVLKEIYSISQTPQVALDFQLYERNGVISVVWDHVDEAFDTAELSASFEKFISSVLNGE